MKIKQIILILIPLNIFLAYLIYNSINSEIKFKEDAKIRIAENIQKLKDLRLVQNAYKRTKGVYADNFNNLIYFLENDSMPIIKAEGETPDSVINGVQMSDELALELGLITRDTTYVLAKESIFNKKYLETRNNSNEFSISNLTIVPHTKTKNLPEGVSYNIDAGEIEIGKVPVQVFEISTTYKTIFTGLDAKNKSYDLNALLKVGSMQEAGSRGNWGE